MRAIAPGKIIISGEHAVVYGAPALAVAVNIHASCEVRPVEGRCVSLYLDDLHGPVWCCWCWYRGWGVPGENGAG